MTKELTAFGKLQNTLTEQLKKEFKNNPNCDRFIKSVLIEISKTQNDPKKDLTQCTPVSIYTAIKKAIDLGLGIDARQHCHLVKYGNNADLQIGYRGFIYAIKREYPDANIIVNLVREGEVFEISREGDNVNYIHNGINPFGNAKILGGYCYISYTLGDRKVSKIESISEIELNKIRSKAKQDYIWKEWPEEKSKVAIVRRACKIIFAGLNNNLLDKMLNVDNQGYDLEKETVPEAKIINDLPSLSDLPPLSEEEQEKITQEIEKNNQELTNQINELN